MSATLASRPPGPKGYMLIGSLPAFQRQRLAFLLSLPRYGNITYMRLGRESVYTLHHPDLIREVLVEQPRKFQKLRLTRRLFNRALRSKPDAQLSQTDAWKKRREVVQGALHSVHIHEYAQTMVEETWLMLTNTPWQSGRSINIYQQMRTLTLRIATRVLFGSTLSPSQVLEIVQATAVLQLQASQRFNTLFSIPLWTPTPNNLCIRRAIKTLDQVIEGMIAQCRADSHADDQGNSGTAHRPRGDLLATLVMSADQLQLDAIREELISLLMSAHETTATRAHLGILFADAASRGSGQAPG